jgi:8-oxo-dGTP pyrophosphatase MutT (NUDIX family)
VTEVADVAAVEVRDGATVLLVRDAPGHPPGVEVLMLQRHPGTAFGSVWAFPGGAVDDVDRAAGAAPPHDDARESRRLGLPSDGARFWAAAIRETLEETGIALAPADLHYLAHWVTPVGSPWRFDTRFFVALAPSTEHVLLDSEHIDSCWIRPADALARHEAGDFELILPTIRNLEAIGRCTSAAELLAAADAAEEPRAVDDGGGWRIRLPGDPDHDGEPA